MSFEGGYYADTRKGTYIPVPGDTNDYNTDIVGGYNSSNDTVDFLDHHLDPKESHGLRSIRPPGHLDVLHPAFLLV